MRLSVCTLTALSSLAMKSNAYLSRIVAIAAACSCLTSAAVAASVSTDPVSVMTYTFPSQTDTHIGIPLMRPSVYEGRIDSVDILNNKISFQGEPGWQEDVFTEAGPHFVYIKTGIEEGLWLTINANDEDTVTVQLQVGDTLEGLVYGEVAAIVPHWTPKTLFRNDPVEGAFLYMYRNQASGMNQAPNIIMVYSQGEWYSLLTFNNFSDTIIYPHDALLVRNAEPTDFTLTNLGVVPMAAQRTAIRTKLAGAINDQRFAYSSVLPKNIGDANLPAREGDFLFGYRNTGGFNDAPLFSFVYSQGIWYRLSNFTNANNDFQLKPGFSYLYRKESTVEPEAAIWRNTQDYLD